MTISLCQKEDDEADYGQREGNRKVVKLREHII